MVKLQLGIPRNTMNMAEMTRRLREAHAATGITVWELSRRANVKERLIELAFVDAGRVTVLALSRLTEALGMELSMGQAKPPVRYVVGPPSVVDDAVRRLAPESVVVRPIPDSVLALRFEGVLVSDCVTAHARPGLRSFLECCRPLYSRIVVLAEVSENRFREQAEHLVEEGRAPPWFAAVEYAACPRETNGRRCTALADKGTTFLVVEVGDGMHDSQAEQWIAIEGYKASFDSQDRELDRVLEELVRRTAYQPAGRSSGAAPDAFGV